MFTHTLASVTHTRGTPLIIVILNEEPYERHGIGALVVGGEGVDMEVVFAVWWIVHLNFGALEHPIKREPETC